MPTIGHLFGLPRQFFEQAALEGTAGADAAGSARDAGAAAPAREDAEAAAPSGEAACSTCSAEGRLQFAGVDEQRAHFRSDWHRLNVRRRLRGRPPLDEESCEALLGGEQDEVSSLSGSEGSSDDEAQASGSAVAAAAGGGSGAQLVLQSGDTRFAVWRTLLGPDARTASAAELRARLLQLRSDTGPWAVILSRGGHFAAAVFAVGAGLQPGAKDPKGPAAPQFQVLAHKTFHRYVVRAKAGGKQSAKDGTGKYAKSAGSQIRRHNEAALRQDILETLAAWRPHFERATRIFLACPGDNATVLFEPGSPLRPDDRRLASVPFTTRRPTFSEAKRVVANLLALQEPPAQAPAAPAAPAAASPPAKPPRQPQPQPQQQQQQQQPAPEPEPPLHQAARRGEAELVAQLLQQGHDPTVSRGKTAYQVAAGKAVRDAFRRHMAAQPEQWDWGAAGVPSPLAPEQEQAQLAREAEKRARLREKEKERKKRAAERKKEAAAAAAEGEISAAVQAAAAAPRGPEGAARKVAAAQQRQQGRREQLAAAAEARMAALRLAAGQQQLYTGQQQQ